MASPNGSRPLRLFNTLTRDVGEFEPRRARAVGMYSCGPTVYAHQHIGNLRAYVFADTLKRALRWKGYEVRHVINITDVGHLTSDADKGDDKLELTARREGRDAWEIAAHYTKMFKDDLGRLGVTEPDVWCKATDHIGQMVAFAEVLDSAGWCYSLPSGLYFDTSKSPGYGRLARLGLAGQRAGARVEVVEGKRDPRDFAIWRASGPTDNRQMEWPSPWGRGAPGWHLECSVMSMEYLGPHFDIHTGGADHPPVHHTNEIAQSEAYLGDGEPWVPWWLHGEFINLKGAKMSKSSGGGALLQDVVDNGYHPLAYRYLLLQAHYRSQVEFKWQALSSARSGLRRLVERFSSAAGSAPDPELGAIARHHLSTFDAAISEDLNTADAMAVVFATGRDDRLSAPELTALAHEFDAVLGLGLSTLAPGDLDLKPSALSATDEQVSALMAQRESVRSARDFALSDTLRQQLAELGAVVEDHPSGPSTWRWA